MTSVSRAPEPYLSPVHVAEVLAAGGAVLTNDHLGARIRWPEGRIEQYERLPSGELEHTERNPDGEVVRREAWWPDSFFALVATRSLGSPDPEAEAEAAWGYVGAGGHQPTPEDATRLVELCGARIRETPPDRRRDALEEAATVVWLLCRAGLLAAETATGIRARLDAALGLETSGAPA